MLKVRNFVSAITDKLSYVAMVIVFFLVCMTTVDVVLRKVSHFNIMGSYELTEMGMVVSIWIAIAYYQVFKGHIRVTMFVDLMPKRAQLFFEIVTHLIAVVTIGFCIYAGYLRVLSDIANRLGTTVLRIPQFPFSIVMVVGEVLFFLLLLIDFITSIADFAKYKKVSE